MHHRKLFYSESGKARSNILLGLLLAAVGVVSSSRAVVTMGLGRYRLGPWHPVQQRL